MTDSETLRDEPSEPADDLTAEPAEQQTAPGSGKGPAARQGSGVGAAVKEFVIVVAMALALSFVVKTWLVQAFWIPSGSMEDTLLVNDRVLVNKLTPNPISLHRGDVVVFSDPGHWLEAMPRRDRGPIVNAVRDALTFVGILPSPTDDHLIKRVIGLPGDHVVCCDTQQRLTVNGSPLNEPYVKAGAVPSSIRFDITVPAGKIWVMGDNRGDSEDSRYHDPSGTGKEGSVPISDVTGRAFAIVWPLNRFAWLSDYPLTFGSVPAPKATATR